MLSYTLKTNQLHVTICYVLCFREKIDNARVKLLHPSQLCLTQIVIFVAQKFDKEGHMPQLCCSCRPGFTNLGYMCTPGDTFAYPKVSNRREKYIIET